MEHDDFDLDLGDPAASFAVLAKGDATTPMVDFRGHDGHSLALPYSRLLSIDFHPISGLTLEFQDHRVRIRGRNLRRLYTALVQHRVVFVQEGDLDVLSESEPFVDRIVVGRAEPELEVELDRAR